MKKILAPLLALVMCLSLVACGGSEGKTPDAPKTAEAPSMPTIGNTAQGSVCDITITSVEYVDKIENGYLFNMWSPGTEKTYKDVTAEEGYSIAKISYHFDYTGKTQGEVELSFAIDYDNGYTFESQQIGHLEPAMSSGIGFEGKYIFNTYHNFYIDDPLGHKGEDGVAYIIVNNAVVENTDKPCVLNVSSTLKEFNDELVIGPDMYNQPISDEMFYNVLSSETLTFNLR